MGECGCGAFSYDQAVRIGDKVLAIEIYPGCEDCCTGLMVTLHLFTAEEARKWSVEPQEEFKPDQYGHAELAFPLVGQEDLIVAAQQLETSEGVFIGGDEGYENLHDYLEDNGRELLRRGLRIRQAELKADETRQRAKRKRRQRGDQ